MLRRTFTGLLVALALVAGFLWYWSADATRVKPMLQTLLSEQAGIPITIDGNLSWRLFPPLELTAESITARNANQYWTVGRLALELDMSTVVRTRDINQWHVQALRLSDVTMLEDGDRLRVHDLKLHEFGVGKPSFLSTTLDYTKQFISEQSSPVPLTLTALATYHPDPRKIELTNTKFSTNIASGICDLTVLPVADPGELTPLNNAGLVSVNALHSFDWLGNCRLDRLVLAEQVFERGTVTLTNDAAVSRSILEVPDFFGGQASLSIDIDASKIPVRWQVIPTLAQVDSEKLMAWLSQRLRWAATLSYNGTMNFSGNTIQELLASVEAHATFNGDPGTISIDKIKEPLLKVAALLKEPGRIDGWPDLWNYERLAGNWRIKGSHHTLDFALDNLTVNASGSYDVVRDSLDILAELQFATLTKGKMFDMNPLLMDLPVPIQCVGPTYAPSCTLAADVVQRMVAQVLDPDKNSALRDKIAEKIETEVPKKYREVARGLLDLLGAALQPKGESEPSPARALEH